MTENTRKVLINRHSPKAEAPIAKDMYLGEIAVSHPTENPDATTIYTRNGDVMVPFASCAMTKTMIDNAIKAADMDYEVVKGADEKYIKVNTATATTENGKKTTFTLSTSDVASDTDLKALSAGTESKFENMTNILSGLTDLVITSVTGDDAIKVNSTETGVGASNEIKLTHKAGVVTSGFKKLTTDAYGHVTASEDVVTADIEGLGFKTSADTADEIAAAIEGLDAVSATTGKYFTAIGVRDGKLVKEEAELPVLSTAKTGTGNVVSSIAVEGHKITYETASVATSEEIAELSSAVKSFSAETVSEFNSAFTAINNLSADTVEYVKSVSGKIESVINAMDKDADVLAGQVVTTVSQVDGKVSETKANVKDLQLGGYSKDASATGDITGTDTINTALSKLENIIAANAISNKDGSIVVTEPTDTTTTTDIKVNINPDENVIKLGGEGLYTDIKIAKINSSSDLVKDEYALYGTDNTILGESIKIYKDQSLVSITLEENDGTGKAGQYLKYTYIDASGNTQSTYVDVSKFLVEAEFKSGVTADASGIVHGVVDSLSETFLTVGPNGFKLSGVQAAINAAKAAATTKVVEGTDDGNNMTITSATGADNSVTYTVSLTDVASKDALDAEIATRKAVDGQDGQTYVANTGVIYITDATSLNDADIKLDAAIKTVSDAITAETKARKDAIAALDSTGTSTDSGHYITSVTITDGIIAAVGESDKVNSASSADKVVNAFSISGYASSESTSLDKAVSYDGSGAQSITFGKNTAAGKSMSFNDGVIDVEIIDCGEY